jgi:hypothetical protein
LPVAVIARISSPRVFARGLGIPTSDRRRLGPHRCLDHMIGLPCLLMCERGGARAVHSFHTSHMIPRWFALIDVAVKQQIARVQQRWKIWSYYDGRRRQNTYESVTNRTLAFEEDIVCPAFAALQNGLQSVNALGD